MHVQRFAGGVCAYAPAKLNLFFEVLAKRPDGYHEIETLMVPLDWYDTLWMAAAPERTGISLECRWGARHSSAGASPSRTGQRPVPPDALPQGADNLVVKALELLRRRAGVTRGADVRLIKRIPTEAGLGGGSSDAAAALVLGNLVWNLQWPRERLAELAAEIGSDVPFFLGTGPAVCRGRGERIDAAPPIAPLDVVVVRPAEGLSTANVYRACRPAESPHRVQPLVEALCRGDRRRLAGRMHNQLEQAAAGLSPWPARLRREFERTDCVAHQMSGSGTSYFGVCRNARHARRVAGRLRARGLGIVHVARTLA